MNRDILPEGHELHWYKVQSLLGRGAFGVTYLARDQNLDQLVAIKEYFPNQFSSRVTGHTVQPMTGDQREMYEWGLDRFIKEARTLAKFKHHNIVRVFSVFEQNNTAYMVMEYERGDELTKLYKSAGPLSEKQLLSIYIPISTGLKLIHDAGFIHRDIKPANIYLRNEDHSPVLLDFGSARKVTASQTQALTSLVTPGYAPFEQFNEGDDKQGPWTDIYALGASLYYGVTGQLPIDSMARGSGLLSTGTDPFVPITKMAAGGNYSAQFLDAIDTALKFHSHHRPQNIIDWIEMLKGTNKIDIPQSETRPIDDDDSTVILPRNRNNQASTPAPTTGENFIQSFTSRLTEKFKTDSSAQPSWQRNAYVLLAASVLGVIVLLTTMNMIFSTDVAVEPTETLAVPTPAVAPVQEAAPIVKDEIIDQTAEQMNVLSASASEAATSGNLFEPAQKSAIYYYQQILLLDDNNPDALAAIKRIVSQYADNIRADFAAGDNKQVSKKMALLETSMVDPGTVATLQQEIQTATTPQQSQSTDKLLQLAKKHLAKGRRTKPTNRNALNTYRQVLKIDPSNKEAQEGIAKLAQYYVSRAKKNLKNRRLGKLARDIKLAESIDPGSASLPKLKKQLKQQRDKATQLLKLAETAFDTGKLTQPAKKNAVYYYKRVSRYDKDNRNADQGLKKTIERLTENFNQHMSQGKFNAAESILKSVESALPKSSTAKQLRAAFSKNDVNPKSDIAMANKTIGKFKRYFETKNINSLGNILIFRKGLTPFLHDFFDNYPSFKLTISNVKFFSNKKMGSADVVISNLINKKGNSIQAGAWSRFKIISKRNKHGRWKILWETGTK